MSSRVFLLTLAVSLSTLGCAHLGHQDWAPQAERQLRDATVWILEGDYAVCTGAVVVAPELVVTSAHCLPGEKALGTDVPIALSDGTRALARIAAVSADEDLGILRLPRPAEVSPLQVGASDAASGGVELLFLGMPLGDREVQRSRVVTRGRCPSYPAVTDAVFADYRGSPGDSGAPLLARDGVIGVVHGGQGCRIAIPSSRIAPLLRKALQGQPRDGGGALNLPR
jgi:S1-C subfamily serine protease